jgi:hypothetical protein
MNRIHARRQYSSASSNLKSSTVLHVKIASKQVCVYCTLCNVLPARASMVTLENASFWWPK